jgi:hypothetical protein
VSLGPRGEVPIDEHCNVADGVRAAGADAAGAHPDDDARPNPDVARRSQSSIRRHGVGIRPASLGWQAVWQEDREWRCG